MTLTKEDTYSEKSGIGFSIGSTEVELDDENKTEVSASAGVHAVLIGVEAKAALTVEP